MKVIHAFGGTFSVTEKVIYTFLYYYVIDNRRYIIYLGKNEVTIRNFCQSLGQIGAVYGTGHLFLRIRVCISLSAGQQLSPEMEMGQWVSGSLPVTH